MVRTYRTEALVLKKVKFGESDNFLTVLTRRMGLIKVLAKGIRRINSRRAPYLDLFSHTVIYLSKGKAIDIVTDVEPLDNFSVLKSRLNRVASAFKLAELTSKLLPEGEGQMEIFDQLLKMLIELNVRNEISEQEVVEKYGIFILRELGFIPRNIFLKGKDLDTFLENVMERKINTNLLLEKLKT